MSEYLVNSGDLVSVADAIRAKGETTETLVFPGGFVAAIETMETGKTGATLTVTTPAEGITVTVTNGELNYTKTTGADGTAVFSGLESGTWTITISDGEHTATGTVDIDADYNVPMSFVHIYGISRDVTSSSPEWARADESIGKTATASVGTIAGSSDFDTCYPWSGIQRETLSTGDVMVKIPKFWYQRYMDGNVEHIKIANKKTEGFTLHPLFNHGGVESDCAYIGAYKTSSNNKSVTNASPQVSKSRATFRTNAKAKGNGWSLIDIAAVSAIQMLILVEFATNNVQSAIGYGYSNESNSAAINTGSCDGVPNLTGMPSGTADKVDVVWRGIEGFWGNVWEFTDGLNFNGGTYYVCNDPSKYADDTASNYTALSYKGATKWSSSYITQEGLDTANPWCMMPSAAGSGSASTYFTDCVWASSGGWKVFRRSGRWNTGTLCGVFAANINAEPSYAYEDYGSRLLYIPQ